MKQKFKNHEIEIIPDKEVYEHYEKVFAARGELHKLIRRVAVSTKLGRQDKSEGLIELDVGHGTLGSWKNYEMVRYYPLHFNGEYELDDDLETIIYLIKEIKKRFVNFQKDRDTHKLEYVQGKKKFAKKHFEEPLTKLMDSFHKFM